MLLLWKIGGASAPETLPWRLWGAGLGAMFAMWILAAIVMRAMRLPPVRQGAFSQSTFRFNTYVAIAVVFNAQGDAGVVRLGELLGVAIPLANVMAVVTFIWASRESLDQMQRVRMTLLALVRNPLIVACAVGMLYARLLPPWPVAVDNTLRLASTFTLPFALISIGGALTFAGLRSRLAPAAVASALKVAALPLVGYVLLQMLGVTGPDRLTALLFFAMPASTAMYVLTRELGGDTDLSSAIIVLSTLASFVSLSVVLTLFA